MNNEIDLLALGGKLLLGEGVQFEAPAVVFVGGAFCVVDFAFELGFCVFLASCAAVALPVPKLLSSDVVEVRVSVPLNDEGRPPIEEMMDSGFGAFGACGTASSSLSPGETKILRSAKLSCDASGLYDRRRRRIILRCEAGREPVGKEEIGKPAAGSSGTFESSPSSCPSEVPLELVLP